LLSFADEYHPTGVHAGRRGKTDCTTRYADDCELKLLWVLDDDSCQTLNVRSSSWKRYGSDHAVVPHCAEDSQAEQERQAAVIRAEGEAEAAATISRALEKAGEAFVAFRKIEASKAIVHSLANNANVTYIPSGGGNVLLNVPTK